MTHFINPADCLDRLPVRMSLREFRKRVISLGLCYKHGHGHADHGKMICKRSRVTPVQHTGLFGRTWG